MSVNEVTANGYSEAVRMTPVYGGTKNAEDNTFAAATPGGKLELTVDNKTVHGFFKPGRKYYVDITECPEDAQK